MPTFTDVGTYRYTITATINILNDTTHETEKKQFSTTATLTILPIPLHISGSADRYYNGAKQSVTFTDGSSVTVSKDTPNTPDHNYLEEGPYFDALTAEQLDALDALKESSGGSDAYSRLKESLKNAAGTLRGHDELRYTATLSGLEPGTYTYTAVNTIAGPYDRPGGATAGEAACTVAINDGSGSHLGSYFITEAITLEIKGGPRTEHVSFTKKLTLDGRAYPGAALPASQTFQFTLTDDTLNPADGAMVTPGLGTAIPVTVGPDGTGTANLTFTFTKPGTYTYTLQEDRGSDAGITYDTTSRQLRFTVSGGGTSEMTVSKSIPADMTFTNTYTPPMGSLTVQKTVTNPPGTAETYRFTVQLTDSDFNGDRTLDGGGRVHFTGGQADVTITGSGSVTIRDLPAGVGYTVTEDAASGAKYTAYVGGVQTSEATGTIPDGSTATAAFTNVYPGTATQTLQLHKQLRVKTNAAYNDTGSTLPAEDFAFPFHVRLSGVTDGTAADVSVNGTSFADAGIAGVPVEAKLPLRGAAATNTATRDLDLAFTFTAAGTYTFAVSEDAAADKNAGAYQIARADASHTVSVTYTVTMDASTGALTAVQGSVTGNTTFVNDLTYNYPLSSAQTIKLQKVLKAEDGRFLPKGGEYSFGFTAAPAAGTPATGYAPSTLAVSHKFGPLDPNLSISSVDSGEMSTQLTFTAPGTYTFTVTEDPFAYPDIECNTPDGYTLTYTVSCRNGRWEIGRTLSPDTADGVLLFTNTCRTGSLTVHKAVTTDRNSQSTAPAGDAFAFTVTLTEPAGKDLPGRYPYDGDRSGTIASGEQLYLSAGQSVTVRGLPIGTKYTVTEDPAFLYTAANDTLDGEITGYAAPAAADFANTYKYEGWPANDVTVTLAKTVTGPGTMPADHGSFVIGMLYSWQDSYYSTTQPGYTMISVPVSLILHSARSIPDNNGAGYAFAFTLKTEAADGLRLGTGKWLLSVPASAFAGNTGEVTVTGKIPVWVKNGAAASYAFTVTEDDAGENATYATDATKYTVTVTVDAENQIAWSASTSAGGAAVADKLTFTNEYVGPAAPTPPTGGPGAAPASDDTPSFGYFRLITLSASSGYQQTVGLPVGDNGTTVHLFEVPTDHYAYEDSAFALGAVADDVPFIKSSEGGVLTIPASARTAGGSVNIGTVTFTNRYIPVPAEMRVQTQSKLTAIGDGVTLPADTYTFTYTLTGALPVSGSAPGARAANQTLRASETARSTDTSITAISAGFAVYSFAEPGDYTFTATQDKGSKPGVTYDEAPQTVTVTVGYDSLANLEVQKVLVDGKDAPDNGRGATLLTFNNTYRTPPPPSDEPKEEPDGTPDKPAARTAAPAAPVAVRVPRTADDMPLGAVWALFGAAAAALAVLGTVWYRRRKYR